MSRRSRRIAPPDRRTFRCPRCQATATEGTVPFRTTPTCECGDRRLRPIQMTHVEETS